MQNKEKTLYVISFALIIILFCAFIIYLINKGFFALSADEAGHTLEAYYWFKGESKFYSIWLPFQKILYVISFSFWNDLIWTPRVLSSLFGLLTLISLMFLSHQLFLNKIITILTGFLGSFSWTVIIFSVLPMTEIYFFFFIVSSLAFLVKWQRDNSNFSLLFVLIFSVIASTVRFESWIFLLAELLLIVIEISKSDMKVKHKLFKIFIISIVLSFFPLYWVYLSYKSTGDILGFINLVAERYRPADIFVRIKSNILFNFISINLFTLNLTGLITFFVLRKNPIVLRFSFILGSTIIISSILTYLSNAMPTHNTWRLAGVWTILLIPFTACIIYHLYMLPKDVYKITSVSLTIALVILSFIKIKQLTDTSFLRKEDISIGEYIAESLLKGDNSSKIFIQQNSWEYSNLLITSGLPERFITDREVFSEIKAYTIPHLKTDDERLTKYNIRYIILKPLNEDYFDMDSLNIIREFNSWIIYKIK